MRIAIISAPPYRRPPQEYVKSLAKGMERMGHQAAIIDAWTEDGMRLPGFDYIAIVAEPASIISAKLPDVITKVLATGSGVGGKKSAAFVKKSGLFSNRTLANLMRAMEKEGMVVNWSDFLLNAAHAEAMGKRIGA